ncbi:hypothetical protein [Cohnella nanjingensis]|uniref:Uncharacterized protein n=1 Tax=Cohnella nanjingensis TaxID=1387779 RepID=A0A7X0VH95_9BACL|nr:hypothetical protein [Cohnella nanjingensis]MBB6673238.1 hypothetical protein [Cohnella nanjingensis]
MRRWLWLGLTVLIVYLLLPSAGAPMPVYAEPMTEETRQLLEKGLTVVEIDREIERIGALRADAQQAIAKNENRIAEQAIAIAAQREKAGRVLRSYYMGQKEAMWGALLNFHSLPELLRTWELMDLMFQADHDTLDRYSQEYARLRDNRTKLDRDRADLARVENDLRAQRERVAALQREVEQAIAHSSNPELLRKQMEEMQRYWQSVGLYEVKQHFSALAKTMNKLPDWIKDHPESLVTSGLKTTLTITDEQLNAFLQSQDDMLKQFTIAFAPGKLTLEGNNGNLQVKIEGHYTVENEPKNAILFHMDQLIFNGLTLPDATRDDLVREFDLGFYPQDLIKFVKADSVSLEEGRLVVGLKLGK